MRIVVMGTGGTGGYFGAKLARAGEDVTFVARGAHLEAIRAHGLRVKSAIDGEWVVQAPVVERLDGLPPADLVLFCVKSFDTDSAGEAIKPVVGPGTGVLPVLNGVDNVEKLERILGPGHVMGGVAQVLATIESPGVISHRFLGRLIFGEMDGRESERARAFLQACERAGIQAEISSTMLRALWEKYVLIAAQAGMTALTRQPAGVVRSVPETRRMYLAILGEMVALGNAAGAGARRCAGGQDHGHARHHGRRLHVLAPPRPGTGQAPGARGAARARRAARGAPRHSDADAVRGVRRAQAVRRRPAAGGQLASV